MSKALTMHDYLQQARNLKTARENEISRQNAEIAKLNDTINASAEQASKAIHAGDQAEYQRVMFEREYCAARVQDLSQHPTEVVPPAEECRAALAAMNTILKQHENEQLDKLRQMLPEMMSILNGDETDYNEVCKIYAKFGKDYTAKEADGWLSPELYTLMQVIRQ